MILCINDTQGAHTGCRDTTATGQLKAQPSRGCRNVQQMYNTYRVCKECTTPAGAAGNVQKPTRSAENAQHQQDLLKIMWILCLVSWLNDCLRHYSRAGYAFVIKWLVFAWFCRTGNVPLYTRATDVD